jgi:hypothetical protein
MPGQTLWAASVPPLFVAYTIDESNRVVYVVVPLRPLPKSGF